MARTATALIAAVLSLRAAGLTVWPKPRSQTDAGTLYAVDPTVFAFQGEGPGGASDILLDAFKRYHALCFLTNGATSNKDLRDGYHRVSNAAGTITGALVIVDSTDQTLSLETNESYSLKVTAPTVSIQAATVFGALRGLETFSQLVLRGSFVNGTTITDHPRYQFRASMIDTSRHYYPLTVILQHLDAMSYSKLNVLHWHIVDSISFPFQSKMYPEMSATGAYSPSHIYTHSDIREVVDYARRRGIRVLPEFDSPGHVREGYLALDPPILTTCYDPSTGKPFPPGTTLATGPLDPTLNATYDFLKAFYAEVKTVFSDKFVHVGGDEVPPQCWASNPGIQAYMKMHGLTSFADLETMYEQRLLDLLRAQNTSYIVWQEIFDNGAKIAPDTVIDVWKAGNWQVEMAKVAAAGFHSVLSAPFYLNYISYGEDWPKYYQVEPSNFSGGAKADADGLIGGVEACMWSEFVDAANFMPRNWPRIAAVAERGWSDKSTTDLDDARRRIHELRCKLLSRDIPAEPVTNGGSATELDNRNFCPDEWVPKYSPPWAQASPISIIK